MKSSILMKSFLASSIWHMGLISQMLTRAPKNNFVILMYHRVIPKNEFHKGIQAGMYVEPGTFESHIRFLKEYFSIRPISEIFSKSQESIRLLNGKPSCVLTFDDGWYDFYTNCFPILKAHGVPATVFLPTDFIGTEKCFWTDRLSLLIYQRSKHDNPKTFEAAEQLKIESPLVRTLMCLRGSLESRLESAIALLKTRSNEDIEKTIIELSSLWGIESKPLGRVFLSWEEVNEMGRTGLISFGSHTATHRILTMLPKEEVKEELIKSKEDLISRSVVDPSFIAFSYPNGNYNEDICQMVKEAGYTLAVTTKKGWNHKGLDPFILKRFPIHQDITSTEAMLGCRIAGLF